LGLEEKFLSLLELHTAGIPTDETVKWTHLKPSEIARLMTENHGIAMSHTYVKRLLKKHGYRRRKLRKQIPIGSYARRNEQFEIIFYLISLFGNNTGPVVSFDTKKKERLGNLYRDGHFYSNVDRKVFEGAILFCRC